MDQEVPASVCIVYWCVCVLCVYVSTCGGGEGLEETMAAAGGRDT